LISEFVDVVLHLDVHLVKMVAQYGVWIYAILFAIIFSETGFVVTPFLPGDSLLFVAGAVAATGGMNAHLLVVLLVAAAFLGNMTNYAIGRWLGRHFFTDHGSRWLNPQHLDRAHAFYDRHGGKAVGSAIILPFERSEFDFVSGMGNMQSGRFTLFNFAGAVLWVGALTYLGFFFGNIPWIKGNLTAIIIGIIVISLAPLGVAWLRSRSTPAKR
jgi:membrane-associated protein